jgi:hypothetical protein
VPLPPKHIQEAIVRIDKLAERERELTRTLDERRTLLYRTLCLRAAEGYREFTITDD